MTRSKVAGATIVRIPEGSTVSGMAPYSTVCRSIAVVYMTSFFFPSSSLLLNSGLYLNCLIGQS